MGAKIKILLADDDAGILEFLSYTLNREGYAVLTATHGKEAIVIAIRENPQLIILDITMPGMDGIETCREIREIDSLKEVPVVFLTARNEEYTQIAGFNAGADDYILKPVKPKILLSRIVALLRRCGITSVQPEKIFATEALYIDKEKYLVTKNGKSIYLRRREFELLSFLASQPEKVFTRDEILSNVWGKGIMVSGRTVDVHMNQLRGKVGDKYFITIKGVGYKYLGRVQF